MKIFRFCLVVGPGSFYQNGHPGVAFGQSSHRQHIAAGATCLCQILLGPGFSRGNGPFSRGTACPRPVRRRSSFLRHGSNRTPVCAFGQSSAGCLLKSSHHIGGQQVLFHKNVACVRGWAEVDGELCHVGAGAHDHFRPDRVQQCSTFSTAKSLQQKGNHDDHQKNVSWHVLF